jgi:hypothetical protein
MTVLLGTLERPSGVFVGSEDKTGDGVCVDSEGLDDGTVGRSINDVGTKEGMSLGISEGDVENEGSIVGPTVGLLLILGGGVGSGLTMIRDAMDALVTFKNKVLICKATMSRLLLTCDWNDAGYVETLLNADLYDIVKSTSTN